MCAGEFDLLRETRQDITKKPWSEPYNRIIRDKWFRVERAREEMVQLDVEISRVQSWMIEDERIHCEAYVKADNLLKEFLRIRYERIERRNAYIRNCLR